MEGFWQAGKPCTLPIPRILCYNMGTMKTAGKRIEPSIGFHASADKLRAGALFNDEAQRMAGAAIQLMPKGVYHYKTHQEANNHWQNHCVKEIVRRNTR